MRIQHAKADVLTIDGSGATLTDSALSLKAVSAYSVVAGGVFTLTHGVS